LKTSVRFVVTREIKSP